MKIAFTFFIIASTAACNSDDDGINCIDGSLIDQDVMCIQVFDPVCGCDANTYSNECEARKAGLTSWTEGECN